MDGGWLKLKPVRVAGTKPSCGKKRVTLGGPQIKLETREVGARLCDENFVCIIFLKSHLLLWGKFIYHLHSIAEKMEAQRGNLTKVS